MSRKADYSKKIIKILGEKTAISLSELMGKVAENPSQSLPLQNKAGIQETYAVTRSLKGLKDAGLVEHISSGQSNFARLTKEGKKKMHSLKLDNDTALLNTSWDGYWRMIILDLPEERKSEREALRYLLKKAGFICIKNSVWVSMYPFEHLFTNIKKDLGLTTEMMIIVTDKIDEDTENEFLKIFSK